jgi:Flp pilus assembly pilin Flp
VEFCAAISIEEEKIMKKRMRAALPIIRRLHRDDRGQDLVEYALIVAFAVGVVAVLTLLYGTIKQVLTKANQSLQSASQ